MAGQPTEADPAKWHRWFAVEANNRAWRLSESRARSAAEDAEMLDAAHAAAYHWAKAGTALHAARAQMLLGHAHALLGHGTPAMMNARAAFDYVAAHDSPPWEVAFAHAVLANAAAAAKDAAAHAAHYGEAQALGGALADLEEREIFDAMFASVPAPGVAIGGA
jgi:hypothetical protein